MATLSSERAVIHCNAVKTTGIPFCHKKKKKKLILNKEVAHLYLSASLLFHCQKQKMLQKAISNLFTRQKVTILSKKSKRKCFQLSLGKLNVKMPTL